MNMRTDIWKGIAAGGLLLLIGMKAQAQCTLGVNIFSDTIACNGNLGGIGPQVSGGSGDFSFQWEPAAMLSNPIVQYPMITASFSQWVTVSVTDNVTGCTASDSLMFYPNIQTNATVELCSGSAELTLDPGSMVYAWTAEDPDGNPIDMSGVAGNNFTATELGTYTVMTYHSGCNQVFHEFEVVGCQSLCPNTHVSVSASGTACGSYLTYSVTNDAGFESVEWTLDGEFLSDQSSGSLFLPDEGTYVFVVTAMDMNGCESVFEQNVDVVYVFPMMLVCSVLQHPCGGEPVGVIEATF
jgi:hypothetical protein